MKIAAMVSTFNEESNIEACLETLNWVDELVLVDSGSKDRTLDIAQKYNPKVTFTPPGNSAEFRNVGLDIIESDWILIVDADERVSSELRDEIQQIVAGNHQELGYYLPRKNLFMRKWIRHCGWYPDYILRLFRNCPEHRFSGLVHESIQLSGKAGYLKNPLIHYTYSGLEQYLNKFNRYTTLSAEMIYERGRRINLFHLIFRPPLEFIKMFILKRGFLDGIHGLIISMMSSMYIFVKFAKAWLKQQSKVED